MAIRRWLMEKTLTVETIMAETEGARRATGVSATGDVKTAPGPEVLEKPVRRKFLSDYKLRILQEMDVCKDQGQIGAILRREGLYSSHLILWRRQRDEGALRGLGGKKRGRKGQAIDHKVKKLQMENARLVRQLKRAQTIIDIQKKVSELLGIPLKSLKDEGID
jgi:hypothetical protein